MLTFVRASDNNAIFRDNAAAVGKVRLDKIAWFKPYAKPSLQAENELLKIINNDKIRLEATFRDRICEKRSVPHSTNFSWRLGNSKAKPRYVIVAFQTGRDNSQIANPSVFDHRNLNRMQIMWNQDRYPAVDYNLSFPNQQFARAYRAASEFSGKFYGMDQLITQSNINSTEFKDLYPIHVFDLTNQGEDLKGSQVDIQIRATFNEPVPKHTMAYAVLISDNVVYMNPSKASFPQLSLVTISKPMNLV